MNQENSAKKKKKSSPGRDERGRFTKGHKFSENQLFEKENAAACKYKPEYADMLIAYFNKPPTRVEYAEKYDKDGNIIGRTPIVVPNEYPMFENFAASIGVDTDTLRNWCEISHRFRYCYARAREMQHGIRTVNAMMGLYNSGYAKFETINNYENIKDRQELDVNLSGVPVADERVLALIERVHSRLEDEEE